MGVRQVRGSAPLSLGAVKPHQTADKLLKLAGEMEVFLSTPPLPLKQVRTNLIYIKWFEWDCIWEAASTRH